MRVHYVNWPNDRQPHLLLHPRNLGRECITPDTKDVERRSIRREKEAREHNCAADLTATTALCAKSLTSHIGLIFEEGSENRSKYGNASNVLGVSCVDLPDFLLWPIVVLSHIKHNFLGLIPPSSNVGYQILRLTAKVPPPNILYFAHFLSKLSTLKTFSS